MGYTVISFLFHPSYSKQKKLQDCRLTITDCFCQFRWEKTIAWKTICFQVWKNSHSDRRELLELSHLRVKMHHELKLYWLLERIQSETPYDSDTIWIFSCIDSVISSDIAAAKQFGQVVRSFQKLCIRAMRLFFSIQSNIADDQHLSLISMREGTKDRKNL